MAETRRPPLSNDGDVPADHGLISLAALPAEPCAWLWQPRIALGKLTVLAGEPGLGKSQFALFVAAAVTAGRAWPDGAESAPQGSVIVIAQEDGLSDTVRPRAEAAGCDVAHVHAFAADGDGLDLEQLGRAIDKLGTVRLVIVDPVTGCIRLNGPQARQKLIELADFAARHRVAVLLITHLAKAPNRNALNRVLGPVAVGAVARAVFLILRNPDQPDRCLLVEAKNNLGRALPLAFRIEAREVSGGIMSSCLAWEPAETETDAQVSFSLAGPVSRQAGAEEEACNFLRMELADGPVAASLLRRSATDYGLSWMTLRRAAKTLAVVKRKAGFDEGWTWELPEQPKGVTPGEDAHHRDMSTFAAADHLRPDGDGAADPASTTGAKNDADRS